MSPPISCGKINKSLLFILLMSISSIINKYLYGFTYIECFYVMNIYKSLYNAIIDPNKTDFPHHRLFDPLFDYLGVIFLSLLIPKQKEKEEKDDNIEELEPEENSEKIRIFSMNPALKLKKNELKNYLYNKKGILIFILILILWIVEENLVLIYVDIFQDLDFWFFELIIISLIYSKYFSFKIYKHQKVAMALSICLGSILKIYNITISLTAREDKIYSRYSYVFFFIILYFAIITARSYVNTQIKVFMDLKFISQRTLLIFYGITGTILCLIVGLITTYSPCPNNDAMKKYICKVEYKNNIYYDNLYSYIESYKNFLVRLIVIVLSMISFFSIKFFYTLIIKIDTPIHVIFSFPIQFFIEKTFLLIFTAIFFLQELFKTKEQLKKFLLDESGDITSILGFLIYLEIIELNFCNLNFNLKKNIISRSKDDYQFSFVINEKLKKGSMELSEDYDDNE